VELATTNSLLEITIFGRRAGRAAALRSKQVEPGKLTLAHVDEWNKKLEEAGIEDPIASPILLPDYTREVR
jgi:succinate dehydrogenase/fumarate reductase flavoprotein subunit